MARSLASFPEEILARILALALPPPRPFPSRNHTAPLLVSSQFLRIASPFFYHTLHLRTAHQAARVLDTLTHHHALASAVRRVVFDGIWHDCAGVLALCNHIQDLDICLNAGPVPHDPDAEAFCNALEQQRTIAHLTLRKHPSVYLTHPRSVYVFQRLARAVERWPNLETVHFGLRISSSPTTLPLARALSLASHLRSVRAQLPAIWSDFLLVISTNPRLERVTLYAEPNTGSTLNNKPMGSAVIKSSYNCDEMEHAVLSTGLYMMETRNHARLSELIKCGTSVIRTRAHTTISTLSTSSAGGTPLGAIRTKEVAVDSTDRDNLGLLPAARRPRTRNV